MTQKRCLANTTSARSRAEGSDAHGNTMAWGSRPATSPAAPDHPTMWCVRGALFGTSRGESQKWARSWQGWSPRTWPDSTPQSSALVENGSHRHRATPRSRIRRQTVPGVVHIRAFFRPSPADVCAAPRHNFPRAGTQTCTHRAKRPNADGTASCTAPEVGEPSARAPASRHPPPPLGSLRPLPRRPLELRGRVVARALAALEGLVLGVEKSRARELPRGQGKLQLHLGRPTAHGCHCRRPWRAPVWPRACPRVAQKLFLKPSRGPSSAQNCPNLTGRGQIRSETDHTMGQYWTSSGECITWRGFCHLGSNLAGFGPTSAEMQPKLVTPQKWLNLTRVGRI